MNQLMFTTPIILVPVKCKNKTKLARNEPKQYLSKRQILCVNLCTARYNMLFRRVVSYLKAVARPKLNYSVFKKGKALKYLNNNPPFDMSLHM